MVGSQRWVEVPGGELAVVDHGGSGPDVLLVHSVAHSQAIWDDVVPLLGEHARVVTYDLRGHGQSEAEVEDVTQMPQDVVAVVRALGLTEPLVVGHDVSGGFVTAAAVDAPGVIGGVVVVDSPVVEPQDAVAEMAEAVGVEVVVDLLTERFGLGRTGPDAASLDAFVEEYVERSSGDWLTVVPAGDATRRFVRGATRVAADGSWEYRPLPQTIRTLLRDPQTSSYRPGVELLERLEVPVTVITLTEGHASDGGARLAALATSSPTVRVVRLEADAHVLHTHPDRIVEEMRTAPADAAPSSAAPATG